MQHHNIWKHNVLSELDSEDALYSVEGVIANSGVAVKYYPFSIYTRVFGEEIETYAFVQSKEDVNQGVVRSKRKLDIIMPTKIFNDNSIVPSEQDKLEIGIIAYYIKNIIFYTRDGRSVDIIENSVLVSFDAIKREGLTRNSLID